MNHQQMQEKVAAQLTGLPGWQQHPRQPFHFRHVEAGVHVLVYGTTLEVVFGQGTDQQPARAVSASYVHFPALALDSVLEVARALVVVRTPKVLADAVMAHLVAGQPSG